MNKNFMFSILCLPLIITVSGCVSTASTDPTASAPAASAPAASAPAASAPAASAPAASAPAASTANEISLLHKKYPLSAKDLKLVADTGCKNFKGGAGGRSTGLTGYTNTHVIVNMIGKMQKTATSNPLATSEIVTDTAGTLFRALQNGGKPVPIYKGKCRVTKIVNQSSTYLGRSGPGEQSESMVYNFVINPKVCLDIKKNPRKYLNKRRGAQCFAMDTTLSGFGGALGENFMDILKGGS